MQTKFFSILPAIFFGAAVFGKGKHTNEQISELRISYSHMSRFSAKSFELQDKDGKTLFSCRFFDDEDEEIAFEKVSVSSEYMQRLREIAKKYDFASKKQKKSSNKPFVRDAPMYGMTLYWPDKHSLRLNYWPDNGEVKKLFEEIVELCIRNQ